MRPRSNPLPKLRIAAAVIALLVLIGAGLNWRFVNRYVSYLWLGGNPLTTPVSWFDPTVELDITEADPLPAARRHTIPPQALEQAAAYALEQNSLGLLVARNGQIEFERYWNGFSRDDRFNPQSMSKTVLGMLVGIAIDEGTIDSVDAPINRWLDEWDDDPRGRISIKNLLQMSAGLAQISTDYRPVPWSKGVLQHFGTDFDRWTLGLPLNDAPGSRWEYNNNESNLLGLVLEQATGMTYPDFLSLRLWQPMGLGPAAMYQDKPGGHVMKSCCLLSRPLDWLALGQLMLNRGRWNDSQVLPAAWVDAMLRPADTNPGYGYQVWLGNGSLWHVGNHPGPDVYTWWGSEPYVADDLFAFLGHGYQNVWVIPSQQLVIVRVARSWPPNTWDVSRIPNLITNALLEKTTSQ
ncbi:MAG: serine hydrolase domain-containing protein [Lysobacterales bacterium]